jgi:hypothetical protein
MITRIGQDLKRSAWLLFTLVLVTVVMRWAVSRGRPERLFDLPSSGEFRLVGIRGENAIFIGDNQSPKSQVQARSLKDRSVRLVGEDDALRNGFALLLGDDAIYFKTIPPAEALAQGPLSGPSMTGASASAVRPPETRMGASPDAVAPMPSVSVRSDAATAMPTASVGNRLTRGTPWPLEGAGDPPGAPNLIGTRPSKPTLRRIKLDGTREEIAVPLPRNPIAQRDYAVLGDSVYFTRFVPDPPPRSSAPLKMRMAGSVELLRSPVHGGKPAIVKRVPGILTMLYGNRGRIFWIVARAEDPTRVDLYHMRAGEKELVRVSDYESWQPAVAAGDRLYWITRRFVRHRPSAAGVTLETSNLVSSRMDGSDRHIVERLIEGGQVLQHVSRPVSHGDRAYLQVSERNDEPDGMNRKEVLCRVRPDLSGLEQVTVLPPNTSERGGFIEDGWYYFAVSDRRQGILDYIRDGEKLEYVEVLYRYRLPEK